MPAPHAAYSGSPVTSTFAEYKCFFLFAVLESNVSLLFTHFDMFAVTIQVV